MAITRLPLEPLRQRSGRAVERGDLRAALTRIVQQRWGVYIPVDVEGMKRGAIHLKTPSVPWRAELLWSAEELCADLQQALPHLGPTQGVIVSLR